MIAGKAIYDKSDKSVAAPIAAPNGHDLATNDNTCHLTDDLGRVVETWQKLSAEARLMIMALVSAAESSSCTNAEMKHFGPSPS